MIKQFILKSRKKNEHVSTALYHYNKGVAFERVGDYTSDIIIELLTALGYTTSFEGDTCIVK